MRITFESGGWVEVIPPQNLKMKHRDTYKELVYSETPLDAEGNADKALIETWPGGWPKYVRTWTRLRDALVAAIILTGWSYGDVRPAISEDGTQLLNRESLGEADLEFMDVIEMYLEQFTREPDPKARVVATTTSSNGRSKAKAEDLKV